MLAELSSFVVSFVQMYPYVFLSAGFFFAHESVFIPSIYLGLSGTLDLELLVILMIVMSVISDAAVHLVGRYISEERIRRHAGKRLLTAVDAGHVFFERYGLVAIIVSRFIYGTRVATQLLSGMYRVPFVQYIIVNTIGMTVFIVALTALLASVRTSFDFLIESFAVVKIAVLGIFLVGIMVWVRMRRKT